MSESKDAKTRAQSEAPLTVTAANPTEWERRYRNMLGSMMRMENPAQVQYSAIATRRFADLALEQGLGNHRPTKVLVGFGENKEEIYFLPADAQHPLGLDIRYYKSNLFFNLIDIFGPMHRFVADGVREYYDLEMTKGKITIAGVTGRGLMAAMKPSHTMPIKTLSDEEKAARAARRQAKKRTPPRTESAD